MVKELTASDFFEIVIVTICFVTFGNLLLVKAIAFVYLLNNWKECFWQVKNYHEQEEKKNDGSFNYSTAKNNGKI